jgi:hypothetical protein
MEIKLDIPSQCVLRGALPPVVLPIKQRMNVYEQVITDDIYIGQS